MAHLGLTLVVDIGLSGLDEMNGPVVELLEIIGRMMVVLAPAEAQPCDIALDGVDVGLLLLGRVRVVHAQVAATAELLGNAEVEADRLGVPHVQEAVRLRRKARHDRGVPAGIEVGLDDVADEIPSRRPVCRLVCHDVLADGPVPTPGHRRP